MKSIWIIAATTEKDGQVPEMPARALGWFQSEPDAIDAIRENYGDLWDGGEYNVAVVQEVKRGLYGACRELRVFRRTGKAFDSKPAVEECKPEWLSAWLTGPESELRFPIMGIG